MDPHSYDEQKRIIKYTLSLETQAAETEPAALLLRLRLLFDLPLLLFLEVGVLGHFPISLGADHRHHGQQTLIVWLILLHRSFGGCKIVPEQLLA